jgi:hypothetical protein
MPLPTKEQMPPGCRCDHLSWGCVPGPVCDAYEPVGQIRHGQVSEGDKWCKHCEHSEECHSPLANPPDAV